MLSIVILAAGQGTRMQSARPKVLHTIAGRTLLAHVYVAASRIRSRRIHVVYGHGGRQVPDAHPDLDVDWVEQERQLGTGHAIMQVIDLIPPTDDVMVLYGDVPLITHETLGRLEEAAQPSGFSLLTSIMDEPEGYGRIIRDQSGAVIRIVEDKDASGEERAMQEVNTGMMVVRAKPLRAWLDKLELDNLQGEFYLTDIVALAVEQGIEVVPVSPDSPMEVYGINTKSQLAEMERYYQFVQAQELMRRGVTLLDPARFDLRGDLEVGRDVHIDVNVVIEGSVSIGNNVSIGPGTVIRDADIGNDVQVLSHCVIENAVIGNRCRVGPFARIRPETRLADQVHVGNFVELKKSHVGTGSKINHLSYVGDSEIGRNVNVGAGTITCNFDGVAKHKTVIEDDVFVGSDTQLVAPVKIGRGATIGAGTTVTRDVGKNTLALSRVEQTEVKDWKKPKKKGRGKGNGNGQ